MENEEIKVRKLHVVTKKQDKYILQMDTTEFNSYDDRLIENIIDKFINEVADTDADVTVTKGDVSIKFVYPNYGFYFGKIDNNEVTCLYIYKVVNQIMFEDISEF